MKRLFLFILILVIPVVSMMSFTACDSSTKETLSNIDDNTVNVMKPTVKYETNGGSKVDSEVTSVVKKEPITTRENYFFGGWYLDKKFKTAAVFPLSVEYDTTLYAKWIKIYDTAKREGVVDISGKSGYSSSKSFDVSPSGFDYTALTEEKMLLEITVSYDVYYRKDYDVLWDVGYAGAPRYEVYLLGKDLTGDYKEDVTAPSSSRTRTVSFCTSADYFANNKITLTFSTNNVQNVVRFKNIEVTYRCGVEG